MDESYAQDGRAVVSCGVVWPANSCSAMDWAPWCLAVTSCHGAWADVGGCLNLHGSGLYRGGTGCTGVN